MTYVIARDGSKEKYSKSKLCSSLVNAGADIHVAKQICADIHKRVTPGQTTSTLFRSALQKLLKQDLTVAVRYSIREAVDSLGPAGFFFEEYLEAMLRLHGYTTTRNIMIQGRAVGHEVDIFAEKGKDRYIIEAKYRNERHSKVHIEDVMYAHARLQDVLKNSERKVDGFRYHVWIITNTEFTDHASDYAQVYNISLTSWLKPEKKSLLELIVKAKAFPITVLPSVTKPIREQFAARHIVLAQDILPYSPQELKAEFSIPLQTAEKLFQEVQTLLA